MSSSVPWSVIGGIGILVLCSILAVLWWNNTELQARQAASARERSDAEERIKIVENEAINSAQRAQFERQKMEDELQKGQAELQKWQNVGHRHGVATPEDLEAKLRAVDQKSTPAVRDREQQLKKLSPVKRALSDLQGNVEKLQKAVDGLETTSPR